MSLESFETQVEMVRAEATTAIKNYTALRDQIDQDPKLTDEGKREAHGALFEDYKPRLKELRTQEETHLDQAIERRLSLIESPNGLSTGEVISFRDAQDRAERIENADEAVRLLERALRQHDKILAHAILRVGLDKNYRNVVDAFTAKRPEMKETISELRQLEKLRENSFARTMHYGLSR
ncbi:hypothetical protein ACO03V_14505 [Microbacterium sp. HMH0099]|uniref:hypothetical protein n=1 Tax=Microbacterium sp. HMH0099 TaxID=3414026 RepID=UPI003BF62CDE